MLTYPPAEPLPFVSEALKRPGDDGISQSSGTVTVQVRDCVRAGFGFG
jgi:hypothetical protein